MGTALRGLPCSVAKPISSLNQEKKTIKWRCNEVHEARECRMWHALVPAQSHYNTSLAIGPKSGRIPVDI